jgi:hypothetical protein
MPKPDTENPAQAAADHKPDAEKGDVALAERRDTSDAAVPAEGPAQLGPAAKYYGTYVGTPLQSMPPRPVDEAYHHGAYKLMVRDSVTLAGAVVNGAISLGFLGWTAVIDPFNSQFANAALGAGVLLSVGDVTYPAALSAAASASAASGATRLQTVVAGYFQPLWQALGYPDLPTAQAVGQKCELLATITGAPATGFFAWQLVGSERM